MLIDRYILKNHIAPFIFANFVLITVFLLQFLMKFADKLVGKGLGAWIIIKLITYNLAWMVVLVVPMSVLVATLMAFGNMAQNNEVAVFKSSGVSLYRMLIIPFLASILIFFLLVRFNNYVYPDANHAARVLMSDISHKKPTLSLVPGVFSQEVSNYSILVREIDENSNRLKKVTIYDNSSSNISRVITAEAGKIYFSKNQEKLLMDLNSGEIHENNTMSREESYRKIIFDKHRIAMNADQFTFKQSSLNQSRGDRELGAPQILKIVDSLKVEFSEEKSDMRRRVLRYLDVDTSYYKTQNKPKSFSSSLLQAGDEIRRAKNSISSKIRKIDSKEKKINKYWVEAHKKYSIPFACIVFILIGAPLGTMTRRGGMGIAGGISLLFFLIYWAFLIGGEKLADRGLVSPFWGIWSANIFLGLLGAYLTYRGAKERVNIDFSWIQRYLPKVLWNKRNNDQDSR